MHTGWGGEGVHVCLLLRAKDGSLCVIITMLITISWNWRDVCGWNLWGFSGGGFCFWWQSQLGILWQSKLKKRRKSHDKQDQHGSVIQLPPLQRDVGLRLSEVWMDFTLTRGLIDWCGFGGFLWDQSEFFWSKFPIAQLVQQCFPPTWIGLMFLSFWNSRLIDSL